MPFSFPFSSSTTTTTTTTQDSFSTSTLSATQQKPLSGQVAIITGASRGIGRDIALTLARFGCNVVIAAKSVTAHPTLPGTIFTVAEEARRDYNVQALPIQCDVRNDEAIENLFSETLNKFNRIDILICNSGALWWKPIDKTPMSRYDLVNNVNVRATFSCVSKAIPIMKKQKFGRIVVMSPPIDLRLVSGKVAYSISKFGMSLIAIGVAQELRHINQNGNADITINALWPSTLIESYATMNFKMSDKSQWRKASILSDCVLKIVLDKHSDVNGCTLIDEEYLKSKGVTDFKKYRCDPDIEPKKAWPPVNEYWVPKDTSGLPPGISAKL